MFSIRSGRLLLALRDLQSARTPTCSVLTYPLTLALHCSFMYSASIRLVHLGELRYMRTRGSRLTAEGEYLQLLLPRFQPEFPVTDWRHDLVRAQRHLRREARLWLLPWAEGDVRRWMVTDRDGTCRYEAAIPSDSFNVIDVLHVNPRAFFYHKEARVPSAWGHSVPDDLLPSWLNAMPGLAVADPEPKVCMEIPQLGEEVVYTRREVPLRPGLAIPTEPYRPEILPRLAEWLPPRSAEEEVSERTYAGRFWCSGLPDGRAVSTGVWWPEPFRSMLPFGDGLYTLQHHQHEMLHCLDLMNEGRHADALGVARTHVAALTSKAESTLEQAWFLPLVMEDEKEALAAAELDHGLRYQDCDLDELSDALAHPDYHRVMNQPFPVTRVLGWQGFLWLRLLEDLLDSQGVRLCEFCGAIIRGRADKKYCSEEENPACHSARNAKRQRDYYARRKKLRQLRQLRR